MACFRDLRLPLNRRCIDNECFALMPVAVGVSLFHLAVEQR